MELVVFLFIFMINVLKQNVYILERSKSVNYNLFYMNWAYYRAKDFILDGAAFVDIREASLFIEHGHLAKNYYPRKKMQSAKNTMFLVKDAIPTSESEIRGTSEFFLPLP